MLRGREPANCVVSPARTANFGIFARSRTAAIGALLVVVSACSGRGDGGTSTRRPPGQGRARPNNPFAGVGQVGNQVKGIEAMPDYDLEAQEIRQRVEHQLPSPLPSTAAACVTMLDAARQYYVDTEGQDSQAVAAMDDNRKADQSACVEETPPVVAACVAILMAKNEGEFAWVLDQCRRAFDETEADG